MYLHVKAGGRVVLSAPLAFTEEEIRRFLLEKRSWLLKSLRTVRETQEKKAEPYVSEDRLLLWGDAHTLRVLPDRRFSLSVREGAAYLTAPPESSAEERERFLKKQLKTRLHRAIAVRMPFWEHQMGLHARGFTIRDMKSRWGSCNTGTGKLTFHLQLISMPPEYLDYVIVHELAHLMYGDHSLAFWALVERHVPAFRRLRKEMKGY